MKEQQLAANIKEKAQELLGPSAKIAELDQPTAEAIPHTQIAPNVFEMSSVPSDALLHPTRGALFLREMRRKWSNETSPNGKSNEADVSNLPNRADVFPGANGQPARKPRH